MGASSFAKFRLLVWKNALLQWRKPVQTLFVLAVPLIFTSMLIAINQSGGVEQVTEDTIYPPIVVGRLDDLRESSQDDIVYRLAYSPATPLLQQLLNDAAQSIGLEGVVGCADASELEEQLIRNQFLAGVVFHASDQYSPTLPQHLRYALRFPARLRNRRNSSASTTANWHTDTQHPAGPMRRSPRNPDDADGGLPPGYNREGFLAIQNAVANAFLRIHSAGAQQLPATVRLQRFPHPPYQLNPVPAEAMQTVLGIMIMIALIYPMSVQVEAIATERERKLTEAMRIMGLPGWQHWLGRLVHGAVLMFIIVSLMTMVLKTGGVLIHTHWTILWLFLFAYAISLICFGMMMSTLFTSANVCVLVAQMVHILMYLVYVVLPAEEMVAWQMALVTLLCNTGMGLGLLTILQLEEMSVGGQWANLFTPIEADGLSAVWPLGGTILMLLLASVIYLLIGLYVEQVKPGATGVSRPWWFLCTSGFWRRSQPNSTIGYMEDPNKRRNSGHFEASNNNNMTGTYAGISMQGLRKMYNQTEALRPFSLDMYQDQITVLLGHNGAGKTTTMSILTGMIEPTDGTAVVNGFDIRTQMNDVRGSIGLCPQHNILFDDLTVAEHIRFYCGLKGLSPGQAQLEITKYLRLMQLEAKSGTRSKALSGGQKRTLSVCIAFCGGSKVILCDEPSSGMDPAARRNLWRIFEVEKAGRTVLLSTHFMDEADVLGDRIAIMNGGDLKAVGTPFYLKKQFGLGYHLNCSVSKETSRKGMMSMLSRHIPNVVLEKDIGTEISFNLPDEHSKQFANMFAELENNKQSLGVNSFGVSLGTLEEVFLKIGSDAVHSAVENLQAAPQFKLLTGFPLISSQFNALMRKKFSQITRSWNLSVTQIVLPSIFILLTALLSLNNDNNQITPDLPALSVGDLGMFGTSAVALLQTINGLPAESLAHRFAIAYGQIASADGHVVTGTLQLTDTILALWRDRYTEVALNHPVAAHMPADASHVEAWFNNQPYHSAPVSLALVHNAILRVHLGPNYAISATNAPMPFLLESRASPAGQVGQMWAFMLAYAMSFVMAMFSIAVVRERSNGANRLQFVSGAKVYIYWACNMLADFSVYLLASALLCACMVGFQEPGYSTATDIGLLFLVLCVFGAATLNITYLLARQFQVQATAFSALTTLYSISGLLLSGLAMGMRLGGRQKVVEILTYVGLIFPHFALSTAMQNLHRAEQVQAVCRDLCDSLETCGPARHMCELLPQCCEQAMFEFSVDGILAPMIYMAVLGLLCAVVNLIADYSIFTCLTACCARTGVTAKSGDQEAALDSDVRAENQRINALNGNAIRGQALVAQNLSKSYKKQRAVDQLSLAVEDYECFGLLGVNGAGKTSTFGMLTGTLPMSAGHAWIAGHNLRTNRSRANRVIGYTPQFDALIEEQTGRQTLEMFCRLRGIPTNQVAAVVQRLATELNFGAHIDKRVGDCSGGNRRKLSTAVAMIGKPVLMFLDEPTTGMDPAARRSVWLAVERVRQAGTAVVLTSHSMDECEALCTRLAIMVNGRFECLGSVQHLKSKFSGGCTLVVKLRRPVADEAAEVARIAAFVAGEFAGATLQKHFLGLLTFAIPGSGEVQWSSMFERMQLAQTLYAIDNFTLSQTTLEEVFLKFAEKQQQQQT